MPNVFLFLLFLMRNRSIETSNSLITAVSIANNAKFDVLMISKSRMLMPIENVLMEWNGTCYATIDVNKCIYCNIDISKAKKRYLTDERRLLVLNRYTY